MSRGTAKKRVSAKDRSTSDDWGSLTWDNLDDWAGPRSVTRGRSYQRQGRVKNLAIAEDGRLLATVQGSERYVVSVWRTGKKRTASVQSSCTCPVGYDGCKHAVATVAAYLQALADNEKVPIADRDDPRWSKLDGTEYDLEAEDRDDDWDIEDLEQERSGPSIGRSKKAKGKPKRRSPRRLRQQWDETIRQHIRARSQEELAELVGSLVQRFPELREEFKERIALAEGDVDRLVTQARHELRERTSEIGWQNHWKGEGHTPDYSRLKHRLERLVELGHADPVVELGRDFITRAMQQIDQSHDEGETATEIAECLPVVFDAVARSSLSTPEKLLFAIDACLQDVYGVVDESVGKVLDASWPAEDWSAAADALENRLKKMPAGGEDSWHRDYRRDQLTGWLASALENANRSDELLAVYEVEARATNSYQRLVEYLIQRRRYDDAERWAAEGIEKTCEKLPGIASALANSLCELARRRKQWDEVGAHAAWQFFDRPSAETFKELVAAAKKAKCEKEVQAAALRFLETGKSPVKSVAAKSRKKSKTPGELTLRVDPGWPLPVPRYLLPLLQRERIRAAQTRPHYDVLLEMAISAKRPDDVLHWYDKMSAGDKRAVAPWGRSTLPYADRVAGAVAKSHPERALEIYRRGLDAHLPQAAISAYESAAAYLKKMRPILKSLGREAEWKSLLAEIREEYRNRPRFMEILDKLEGRTVLETQKARRRRR